MKQYYVTIKHDSGNKFYLKESIVFKSHNNENVFKRRTGKISDECYARVKNDILPEINKRVLTHKKFDALVFSLEEAKEEVEIFDKYKKYTDIKIEIEEKK